MLTNSSRQYFNRFFDSFSVRYLYKEGERHEWIPERSEDAEIEVADETTKTRDATIGISGAMGAVPAPLVEAHIQKDRKVTVSRKMKSWRRGVSMDECEFSPITRLRVE